MSNESIDGLKKFLRRLETADFPPGPPLETRSGEGWIATVLYREPPFQAECFKIEPNIEVVPHRHPNVTAVEWYQSGEGYLVVKDRKYPMPAKTGLDKVLVRRGVLHGAIVSEKGLHFISVQEWFIEDMTSVSVDWEGPEARTERI